MLKESLKSQKHFWSSLSLEERKEKIIQSPSALSIYSEIGRLKKVLIHTPGREVELMTPKNAAELLYNDIIYYKNIVDGHEQLKSILSLVCQVAEVTDYLTDILKIPEAREELINEILNNQRANYLKNELNSLEAKELSRILVTGMPLKRNSLELWLSEKTFSLIPQSNMYFMRDTSIVIGHRVVASKMASHIRCNEAAILRTIYNYHPSLSGHGFLLDAYSKKDENDFSIEGGDVIVLNEDLILIGLSERTSSKAIDSLLNAWQKMRLEEGRTEPCNAFCVVLPKERSTIHLDMIFTVINREQAVVYSPYILGRERLRVVRIRMKSNGDNKLTDIDDLLLGLRSVGVRIDPIPCGGDEVLHQQREQWNSGANLFAFAPGKAISYMHEHTLKACESSGFKIYSNRTVLKNPSLIQKNDNPTIVTVEGSELSRGGGGPRCMLCPIARERV